MTNAKTRIRTLLKQHDALAGRYADALIAGQTGWAAARKRRLDALGQRVARLAKRHGLEDWTRDRLAKD